MTEQHLDLRDPQIFERAYAEHRPRAYAAALGVLREPRAAEDVVQDVFAELWRRPRSFDGRRGSLRSYVAMLARSRALDRWRSQHAGQGAVERLAARTQEVHEPPAADAVIARDGARRALKLVDGLPPAQREAVLLTVAKGMTAGEVAQASGVPVGTVKSRIRIGLAKMRATAEAA